MSGLSFKARAFCSSAAIALFAFVAPAQAYPDEFPEFKSAIESRGFTGNVKKDYSSFNVGDVQFRPDGSFTGTLYWHTGRGNVSFKGTLNKWTITIDEIAPVGRNRKPFGSPCHFSAEIVPGKAEAAGDVRGCTAFGSGSEATLSFKTKSPRNYEAEAASQLANDAAEKKKAEQAAVEKVEKDRDEAILAFGSARFAKENCPNLSVDFQQLTEVMKKRGVTYQEAEASDYNKGNMKVWHEKLQNEGRDNTCYMFQVHYVQPYSDLGGLVRRRD